MRPVGQSSFIGSLANPAGAAFLSVPERAFTSNASDPDGIVVGYQITDFPAGADAIRIAGATYAEVTFPLGGVFVSTSNAALIEVDPAGSDAAQVNVNIPFDVMDNANVLSSTTYAATLQLAAVVAADGAVAVRTLSPGWLGVLLLLVAMIAARYGRAGFSRRQS
jgi:hypothetical protein